MCKPNQVNSLQDLTNIAQCHIASFPGSFSTKLGLAYNIKSLEWFLSGDNRFLYCIEENKKIIGYCGGFQSKRIGDGSTSGMMQHAMKEAAYGMFKKPWLFFQKDVIKFYPLILKNIISKAGFKKGAVETGQSKEIKISSVGLVVIGIHPSYRGKGYFEALMKSFEEESKKRNASKMTLSVKATNARAIAAYKKMGWQISSASKEALEMYKPVNA